MNTWTIGARSPDDNTLAIIDGSKLSPLAYVSPRPHYDDTQLDNATLIVRSVNLAPKLAEALREAREALYNVPEVGRKYDQQHSDTHMRASMLIEATLAKWEAQ